MPSPAVPSSLRPFVDPDGRLIQMPKREKKRIEALSWIAAGLPRDVEVSETQINTMLRELNDDVAMLRRYLVDYGFIDRPTPGRYRLPEQPRPAQPDS